MAIILNIETATETCSVALAKDGKVLHCRESAEPKVHASQLTIFIDEVIKTAKIDYNDLDAVAVSKGPGSYTGLRVGVSTAKGLCFALDKPLLSVNTLLAFSTHFKNHYLLNSDIDVNRDIALCPMIDARRMEVYTAVFDMELSFLQSTQALILDQHSFSGFLQNKQMVFFGNGATKWQLLIHTNQHATFVAGCETSAKGMSVWSEKIFKSGVFEDLAYFEPYYLKDFISNQLKRKS